MEYNKKRKRYKNDYYKKLNSNYNKKIKNNDNNLPGYFFDKEKNRYFPINNDYFNNNNYETKTINFNKEILNKKIKNNYNINNFSKFFIYKNYKFLSNKEIKNSFLFNNSIVKDYELINIEKFNNMSCLIYKNKYFISLLKDSLNYLSLTILKINNKNYIKKIFFYNFHFDNSSNVQERKNFFEGT